MGKGVVNSSTVSSVSIAEVDGGGGGEEGCRLGGMARAERRR